MMMTLLTAMELIKHWKMLMVLLLQVSGIVGLAPCPCLLYDVNQRDQLGIFSFSQQISHIYIHTMYVYLPHNVVISSTHSWTHSFYFFVFQESKSMKFGLQDRYIDQLSTLVETGIRGEYWRFVALIIISIIPTTVWYMLEVTSCREY